MNDIYTIDSHRAAISDDINAREVVHDIIYGTPEEKPRGQWVVVQQLVRDEKGAPKISPLASKHTGEGSSFNKAPNTTVTGYLCNEKLARSIIRPASIRMSINELFTPIANEAPMKDVAYFSHIDVIKEHDLVYLLKVDENGSLVQPVDFYARYIVMNSFPKYSDNGRIEFYMALLEIQK